MKKMSKKLVVLLMIVFVMSNVMALGITPGRITLSYEPGSQKILGFSIINSEKKEMNLELFARGELNESISLAEDSLSMGADESERKLSYSFSIPSELSPGPHSAGIVVVQSAGGSSGNTFIGAATGVETEISVFVPYPGKYIEADLNIYGQEEGKEINFVIPVVNRGLEDLEKINAAITIYSSNNKKIAKIDTNEISLASGERGELNAAWVLGNNVPSGNYRAVAKVMYHGSFIELEKNFVVGAPKLNLESIEVTDFKLGGVAEFKMTIENEWDGLIKGAYAHMTVYDDKGAKIGDFTSPSYDVLPLSRNVFVSYWDTANVGKGIYNSSVVLNYAEKSDENAIKLNVSEDKISVVGLGYVISKQEAPSKLNNNVILVIFIVGILILVNFAWFLYLRKRFLERTHHHSG